EIRGVTVSPNIVRTLMEREWIRVVGHRDVPGRPEMFGTTRHFLDYFGLKSLDELPPLADLSDWESLRVQLNLPAVDENEDVGTDMPQIAEVTRIPMLEPESPDDTAVVEKEAVGDNQPLDEQAGFAENDFEPIEATEWPRPTASDTVVRVLDPDEANEEMQDDEGREDASVSGA
ncbi:MAG: SMC-Scp complex subunit ScpB, partial [Gammaproteobacteria bacterium]|nr:SMC-Scp complex subunit ScpB [Gammaproteobacteria bacterium]